ncbi:GNAT family N-acetyltransferase [Wukongibacter sp. M2B1]|uniref:GNAT family N-acetyltransferase n=1 Tax=Wukongibacter sp. M2B1 TaxID=3088895 RepID=UPI003D7B7EF9
MIIRTKKSKAIIEFLKKDLLINLNILGIIENIPETEIYVDDEKNPKGVFIKKDYMHYIYSKEDSFIDEIAKNFFKEGFFGFAGVEKSIAKKIKDKFQLHWENPCTLYYLPEGNLNLDLIKNEVHSINMEDVETVNKYYEYSNSNSLEAIRRDIEDRPSSAIYVGGEILSWVLVHEDNSMGIMYTKEGHRKKGYAVDVSIDLADKIIRNGKIPYLQIVEKNNMSPGLAKKCGFVECGQVTWFGIIAGIPKELIEINRRSYEQFKNSIEEEESFLSNNPNYYGMYSFLNNFYLEHKEIPDFSLKEVKGDKEINRWCDVVVEGLRVSKYDIKRVKKILFNIVSNNDLGYKLYIGELKGKTVSASALLKSNEDEEAAGLYFLSTLAEIRDQGIEAVTAAHTMIKGKEGGFELVVLQSNRECSDLFQGLGFKISHSFLK